MNVKQLTPQQIKLLSVLRLNVRVSNRELSRICCRYGARLKELRDMGYKIDTIPGDKPGLVYYRRTAEIAKQGWLL
jgi:hypothetical protein